jgi:hypothetical protein
MDNYYGIKATELMPIGTLVTARLNAAARKAAKQELLMHGNGK